MAELASKPNDDMTVEEFLNWNPGDGRMWQLVDGVPVAMAPPSRRRGAVQNELGALMRSHLVEQNSPCSVVTTPGVVTPLHAERNMRIPGLAVTCADVDDDAAALPNPVLAVEVLSSSNQAETWIDVWTYATIPSVREILVLHTDAVRASVLRRQPDGTWPDEVERVTDGDLLLNSIGFHTSLANLYRTTALRRAASV